jgi:hypothetical protein
VGFSQSGITYVNPPELIGSQYYFSWETTNPAGTWWQIYLNQQLSWAGQVTSTLLPAPPILTRIDIGWVLPGEEWTSYASSLPTAPESQALVSWVGGSFESANIAGFWVYAAKAPGGAIDYAAPVATITAYPAGMITDGYGLGNYGDGGFGMVGGVYSWTSGTLTSGVWDFAVVPFDTAGNAGTGSTTSVTIGMPPAEVPPFPDLTRLHYTYAAPPYEVTLDWLPTTG